MAKFYVQCGNMRVVLAAEGVECAAMAGLERALQSHLWIYDDLDLSDDDCRTHLMLEALMHLEPAVRVSEQGFDREDAVSVGTPETIDRWHRLMIGINRLFVAAGLLPRPIHNLGGIESDDVADQPRRAK